MLQGTPPGACLGSTTQPLASQPAGCEWGPVVGAGAPARLLPNERQLAICFLSAPRCSSTQGDEERRGQAVPRHRASPRSAPATRVRVPGGVRWRLPGGRTGHGDAPAGNDSILALDIVFFWPSDGRAHCLCPPQHETCPPRAPVPRVGMLPMAPLCPGNLGPNSLQITFFPPGFARCSSFDGKLYPPARSGVTGQQGAAPRAATVENPGRCRAILGKQRGRRVRIL